MSSRPHAAVRPAQSEHAAGPSLFGILLCISMTNIVGGSHCMHTRRRARRSAILRATRRLLARTRGSRRARELDRTLAPRSTISCTRGRRCLACLDRARALRGRSLRARLWIAGTKRGLDVEDRAQRRDASIRRASARLAHRHGARERRVRDRLRSGPVLLGRSSRCIRGHPSPRISAAQRVPRDLRRLGGMRARIDRIARISHVRAERLRA